MFGKRKEDRPKRSHDGKNLAQYGLFNVPTDMSFVGDDGGMDDNDSDLEAELLALTSNTKPKQRPKPKPLPTANLDAMIANSMRDIPSDEELSGDEDDPELMNELKELTQGGVEEPEPAQTLPQAQPASISKLLEERLHMYIVAEENAKKAGESSRARRFNRAIKTIKDLIRQANAGKPINNDDIPPEVSTTVPKQPAAPIENKIVEPDVPTDTSENEPVPLFLPTSDSTAETKPKVDQQLLNMLTERRSQYKVAALTAKKAGDIPIAVNFMKLSKQFDVVIQAVENGEPVDLSRMPGPPAYPETQNESPAKEESEAQQGANTENPQTSEDADAGAESLITAGSIAEALEQRLQLYKAQEEKAKSEGNSSKARRMGRIVKQFEQAIKQHQAGKPVTFDELPTPPGYAPIPVNPPATPQRAAPAPPPRAAPALPPRAAPAPPPRAADTATRPQPESPTKPPLARASSTRKMGNQVSNTHLEKQVAMLMARQREFKEAALQAKKMGEIAQAKELLKTAMGFNKVIDAARGGFPIDMESLPVPPSSRSVLEESYEVVIAEECQEDDTGTIEMLTRLEEQLTKQLKMCLSTRDHHKALGDVTGVNRFENLALSVTKDLDVVRLARRTTFNVPRFHYESKSFAIVKCCTDLNDNDLELVIVRGINYVCPNPKEIDTYVKFEFPFPQEEPFRERTSVVKDTNNPEYNASYKIPIQRNSRQCLRVFKRQSVKLEVYSRGGFFRSDTLLGTVTIKLQHLETQCEFHDSFDLMDGRKKTGGKLEVKMRVRHPLVSRQVEQLNEKWLVLNH